MDNVLDFFSSQMEVSASHINIIKAAAQNILYNEDIAWSKRASGTFDVTMGGYAGAEICEAVGLWILFLLKNKGIVANLYRDDGLLMSSKTPRQVENVKKNNM